MTGPLDAPVQAQSAKAWSRIVARYRTPSVARGVLEILVTVAPLAVVWASGWLLMGRGQWWAVLLAVPAAGLVLRLFVIQHDCGHGAFFKSRLANDWVGRISGVVTLTPYSHWRQSHGVHHATSGNLDQRGLGAVDVLTVDEYVAMPGWRRRLYRLYRRPLVLFGLAPSFVFFLQQRLPIGYMRAGVGPWISVMGSNLAIAGFVIAGIRLFGPVAFLAIYLPTLMLAATIGVWLFYVQHQFERTSWARQAEWNPHEAALHGSSNYALPAVLRWFTANIGVHHVHHLNSRIPFYRMDEVLRDHPQLRQIGRMTLGDSFATLPLTLWDSRAGRLVSFREAARLIAARGPSRDLPGLGRPFPPGALAAISQRTGDLAAMIPPFDDFTKPRPLVQRA